LIRADLELLGGFWLLNWPLMSFGASPSPSAATTALI
jgi:hypothetical protein